MGVKVKTGADNFADGEKRYLGNKFISMVAQESILDRVFHILAKSPSPEEILAISTSEEENLRLEQLASQSKQRPLSTNEEWEFQQYRQAERYVRLAKAYAFAKLNGLAV